MLMQSDAYSTYQCTAAKYIIEPSLRFSTLETVNSITVVPDKYVGRIATTFMSKLPNRQ